MTLNQISSLDMMFTFRKTSTVCLFPGCKRERGDPFKGLQKFGQHVFAQHLKSRTRLLCPIDGCGETLACRDTLRVHLDEPEEFGCAGIRKQREKEARKGKGKGKSKR